MAPPPTSPGSFEGLFSTLRAPVFKLCLRLLGNGHDAEDVVQEVFCTVYRELPRFRGESLPSTWVYRIAVTHSLRYRQRQPAAAAALEDQPLVSGRALPDAELSLRQEAGRLQAALLRLAVEHRVVLSLSYLQEISHKEIAGILGIPEGTVGSRLHAARRRLLAELNAPSAPAGGRRSTRA